MNYRKLIIKYTNLIYFNFYAKKSKIIQMKYGTQPLRLDR